MTTALVVVLGAFLGLWAIARLKPVAAVQFLLRVARRALGMRRRTVRVAGETWVYLEGGQASAPVILFVHGYGADKDMWLSYSRLFSGHYQVISPDLPGFGEATRDPDRDYSPRAQARRLAAFCDALRIKDAHVVGSSMGGFISAWLAVDRADLVRTLTLMNAAGLYGENPSVVQTVAESGDNPLVAADDAALRTLLDLLSYKPMRLPRFVRDFLLEGYQAHQALLDRIFWQLVDAHDSEGLEPALARVRAPTLIVWGKEDQVLDASCAAAYAQAIPGAQVVMLEQVGHVPMYEAPAATADAQRALFSPRD
ncbi:MAG: alpha/beta fold hydrolase [Pseudomonadota bacterium]